MDEHKYTLPSAAVAWATAATTPSITRIQLPNKTVHKSILIEIAGEYDQSVGAETQATAGCRELVEEVRVNLAGGPGGGGIRRAFKGPMLYELNRIINRAAFPQTDPAVGVANDKAFNTTLLLPFGLLDTKPEFNKRRGDLEEVQAKTFLDLANYPGENYLEIVWNPFNRYASGNTQANMDATVVASPMELLGMRIPAALQAHFEMPLVNTMDMNLTGNDRFADLFRDYTYSRGVLVGVGSLSTTPVVRAITPLTNLGLIGTYKNGPSVRFKEKANYLRYLRDVGNGRNGIVLTAGFLWLDHANDFSYNGGVNGNRLSQYQFLFDSTALANYTMQVFQAVVRK